MSHTFDLRAHLAAERVPVEAALERALEGLEEQLPLDVGRAARHGVMSGGKRLRPILCVEAFRACGGVVGAATYDVAASL